MEYAKALSEDVQIRGVSLCCSSWSAQHYMLTRVIVPATPPLFIPTSTATRAPESYVNEAELLMQEGKFSQAITAYRDAIKVDPDNPSNYITLAKLLIYTANYEEAETNAANALLLNPNNSMAYAVRGWALAFMEDYLNAEAGSSKRH